MCDFLAHVDSDDLLGPVPERRLAVARDACDPRAQRRRTTLLCFGRLVGRGIHDEDRRGYPTFFSFVTMTVGCMHVVSTGGPSRAVPNVREKPLV
jgi:hypothetical protein